MGASVDRRRRCPLLFCYCTDANTKLSWPSAPPRLKDASTCRRPPVAALLCRLMDASEGLRHHRPLHLCCPTDVSVGHRGRLPFSSAPRSVRQPRRSPLGAFRSFCCRFSW
ncbi:hypothetical protein ACQJBY_028894 [Aegilops geniculata]